VVRRAGLRLAVSARGVRPRRGRGKGRAPPLGPYPPRRPRGDPRGGWSDGVDSRRGGPGSVPPGALAAQRGAARVTAYASGDPFLSGVGVEGLSFRRAGGEEQEVE